MKLLKEKINLSENEGDFLPRSEIIDFSYLNHTLDSFNKLDRDEQEELIGDYLTDEYGFCHNGFRFEVIEKPDDDYIKVTNIDWDLSEGCKSVKEELEPNEVEYKKGWVIRTNKDEDGDNDYDVIHNGTKEYSSDDKSKCVDYINKYCCEGLKESYDEYELRDKVEELGFEELSKLIDKYSSCVSQGECNTVGRNALHIMNANKEKLGKELYKELLHYFGFHTEGLEEDNETGYDHYGAKTMRKFEGPAFIEYDGGPRQVEVLTKSRNGRWVWKNEGGCPDSEWYKFPTYEDALKVQKQVGGEILSWNEYAGINESLKEDKDYASKEYCVMKDGNNIDCFQNIKDAIKCCNNEGKGSYVLEVHYDENENEIGTENVYEYDDESLKEEFKVGDQVRRTDTSPFEKSGATIIKIDGDKATIRGWSSTKSEVVELSKLKLVEDKEELPDAIPSEPIEVSTEPMEEVPAKVEENGVVSMINSLIVDEFEAIEGYNSVITTLTMEDPEKYANIIKVLNDISTEEMVHVGELQEVLKKVSPDANAIEDGHKEAQDTMNVDPAEKEFPMDESLQENKRWVRRTK